MAKLRYPISTINKVYNIYSDNEFPDIDRNYIFLIKEAGTYNLSVKEGFSGARLLIRNDTVSTISIQLTYLTTITINSNKLAEIIWDNISWFKISVDVETPLLLGETETTAYRGDRGKAAYDHISLTSVHEATSANTASRIVLRDTNGDFSAGTITASNITSTGNITGGSLLSLKGTTSADPAISTPILRFYNSGEAQYVQFRYSDYDSVHGAGGGLWLQGYGTGGTPAWLDVDGAVYASAFYGPLVGASYIQSAGNSTSWGITNKTSTGAYNALMGTSTAATWLLSGTSGGTFRCGIQALDSDGMLRFYQGANYFTFSGGTITATTFSGTLSGNVSGGTCAPSYLTIPSTASTTNGRMWIA